MSWEKDKRWSDRFIPEMSGYLGRALICEPPIEEDQERNSDLMVLGMNAVRIGCRIRKHRYLSSYGDQFTIRSSRPRGTKTELRKIVEGWGTHFFYGFCDETEQHLEQWFVGDLNVFRSWFADELIRSEKNTVPGLSKQNTDKSSGFAAFRIDDLPSTFVIARHGSRWNVAA